jgi:hypothetical protein
VTTPTPQDPITALVQAAASVHEMFLAYLAAGFTEQQALYLIAQVLAAGATAQQGEQPQ